MENLSSGLCDESGKIPDNDLPEIARAYRAFREKNPEPGK